MSAGEGVLREAALRRKVVVFESFVHRKSAGYTKWAYSRLYSWHDAREAANIAFYRIYVRWDALMASDSVDAFSFKILRDAVIDVLRKRDRCPLGPVWSPDHVFGSSPARWGPVLIGRQSWREAISPMSSGP